jgi:UMF1 family MFS transporter
VGSATVTPAPQGAGQGSRPLLLRRPILAWAFYDWANSAFATTVMAGFFPVFFRQYWSLAADPTVTTFRLGVANGIASLILALFAPLLGAIADRSGARMRFLIVFSTLGIVMTGSLYFVAEGAWWLAMLLFLAASLGFAGSNIFYDSLLIDVAPRDRLDVVSAFGFGLGYLGGGVLFAINVWMTLQPERFGLADAGAAVRVSFLMVAVWWLVFALPLVLLVRERAAARRPGVASAVRGGLAELGSTFREIRGLRPLALFLVAYWLYIDGVHTIQKMAVDYGLAIGFPTESLIVALLVVQFVGFPAALGFGWLGERFGTLTGIYLGLAVYGFVTIWAVRVTEVSEFYVIAVAIGLVQGGIQSLSRSYFGRLIPADRPGEFFGFYNMMGKFAAVIGPFLAGGVALATGSPRAAILSLIVLFIAGAFVLALAHRAERAQRPAA